MNPNRKHWNEQQKSLQKALMRGNNHDQTIKLFLAQHAATQPGGNFEERGLVICG